MQNKRIRKQTVKMKVWILLDVRSAQVHHDLKWTSIADRRERCKTKKSRKANAKMKVGILWVVRSAQILRYSQWTSFADRRQRQMKSRCNRIPVLTVSEKLSMLVLSKDIIFGVPDIICLFQGQTQRSSKMPFVIGALSHGIVCQMKLSRPPL